MSNEKQIELKGVRVNNLKNIDVLSPEQVHRHHGSPDPENHPWHSIRYMPKVNGMWRAFGLCPPVFGRMNKPECDFIKGIPPAIAIEQKVNTRNPRSTVGTSTEIYEYLRLLYARIGNHLARFRQ